MSERRTQTYDISYPDGGFLRCYVSLPPSAKNWAVLYVHGFGYTHSGEKAQALEIACARRDWAFASFDFRGHGASAGSMLELRCSALLEDLDLVRNNLATVGIQKLCLVGSSMGAWAVSWYCVRHPGEVPASALIAPAFDFPHGQWARLTEPKQREWQKSGRLQVRNEWVDTEIGYALIEDAEQFPLTILCAELQTPLVIFHGMQDLQVPYLHSLNVVKEAIFLDLELRLFKDGDHRLDRFKYRIAEATCKFFEEYLDL